MAYKNKNKKSYVLQISDKIRIAYLIISLFKVLVNLQLHILIRYPFKNENNKATKPEFVFIWSTFLIKTWILFYTLTSHVWCFGNVFWYDVWKTSTLIYPYKSHLYHETNVFQDILRQNSVPQLQYLRHHVGTRDGKKRRKKLI